MLRLLSVTMAQTYPQVRISLRPDPRKHQLKETKDHESSSRRDASLSADENSIEPRQDIELPLRPGPASLQDAAEPEASQLRLGDTDWLDTRYRETKWMKYVMGLACIQVIPLTVCFFVDLGRQATAVETLAAFVINIFLVQPSNCVFAICLDLWLVDNPVLQLSLLGIPVLFWLLFAFDMIPLFVTWGIGFDVLFQVGVLLLLSILAFRLDFISRQRARRTNGQAS